MKQIINLLPNRKEYCFLVKRAFDNDFCDDIISDKKESFKKAITHYPTSYRNNERQVLDNEDLSKKLFQEIKNYIPEEIKVEGISKQEFGIWKLDSLNSRIRICRYLPNQYFNKHLDGVHFVSGSKQSKLSFMIYLNGFEDFDGGKTLFFDTKDDNTVIESYTPEKGDLIIFDHNLWHSGDTVLKGEKYILRSDIIYQKKGGREIIKNEFCGEGHLGYIWTAATYKNKLITSGRDKKIKIWSKQGKKVNELNGHNNSILSLIVLNENTLLSASRDKSIKIWESLGEDRFQLKNSLFIHEGTVLTLCSIDENMFLSGGADGVMNLIDCSGKLLTKVKAHNEWIWQIVKVDNATVATVSEEGSIKIWKLNQNADISLVTEWKGEVPINSITIEDSSIYIGRLDGEIIELALEGSRLKKIRAKKCHQGIIRRLTINNEFLYSASEDNTMKVWAIESLEFIKSYQHNNFVQDIVLFDNSVITVSYDGEIRKNKLLN